MKISIEENNFPLGSEILIEKNKRLFFLLLLPLSLLMGLYANFFSAESLTAAFEEIRKVDLFKTLVHLLAACYAIYIILVRESILLGGDHIVVFRRFLFFTQKDEIDVKDIKYIYFETNHRKFLYKGKLKMETKQKDIILSHRITPIKGDEYAEKLNHVILNKEYVRKLY